MAIEVGPPIADKLGEHLPKISILLQARGLAGKAVRVLKNLERFLQKSFTVRADVHRKAMKERKNSSSEFSLGAASLLAGKAPSEKKAIRNTRGSR